jgi:hypothetical protein
VILGTTPTSCRKLASIQCFEHAVFGRVWTRLRDDEVILKSSVVLECVYFWLGALRDVLSVLVHVLNESGLSFVHGVAQAFLGIVKPCACLHRVAEVASGWLALVCEGYLRVIAVDASSTRKLASLVLGIELLIQRVCCTVCCWLATSTDN